MNENDFRRELKKQAQEIAKEDYETNWGGSWDEADKYEREDFFFDAYEKLGGFELDKKIAKLDELRAELKKHMENDEDYVRWHFSNKKEHDELVYKIYKLKKEIKDMIQRDSKGRFVSTKVNGNNETTNKINLKKENDTMNKTMTKAEERTMKLAQAGVDTSNFFNLSMQIPFGAEVKIMVDGKEMVIPATNGVQLSEGGMMIKKMLEAHNAYANNPNSVTVNGIVDPIAQSIINDGYVKNSKLFRRFVLAHTMKLLEYVDRKNPNRKGWEAGFKDMYGYGYQFEMLADELHTLAKLQKEDPEYFAERTKFFNGDVVVATLEDYLYRLKKYCKKQMRENPRTFRGQAYVKLARYGNVLVKDLDMKVYRGIEHGIDCVKGAVRVNEYTLIEKAFKDFMANYYNKLPYETPKCAVFKDAYKGIGAFESLKNMIRFHNVVLDGCDNKYDSEAELYNILKHTHSYDVWSFHQLLVSTIELNKFNLRQSIANGHAAPNTISDKADRYRR